MNLQEAMSLIEPGIFQKDRPQHWADLGCGNGAWDTPFPAMTGCIGLFSG